MQAAFRIEFPNGDYIDFVGSPSLEGDEVTIMRIEVNERGNIYDPQGAD